MVVPGVGSETLCVILRKKKRKREKEKRKKERNEREI